MEDATSERRARVTSALGAASCGPDGLPLGSPSRVLYEQRYQNRSQGEVARLVRTRAESAASALQLRVSVGAAMGRLAELSSELTFERAHTTLHARSMRGEVLRFSSGAAALPEEEDGGEGGAASDNSPPRPRTPDAEAESGSPSPGASARLSPSPSASTRLSPLRSPPREAFDHDGYVRSYAERVQLSSVQASPRLAAHQRAAAANAVAQRATASPNRSRAALFASREISPPPESAATFDALLRAAPERALAAAPVPRRAWMEQDARAVTSIAAAWRGFSQRFGKCRDSRSIRIRRTIRDRGLGFSARAVMSDEERLALGQARLARELARLQDEHASKEASRRHSELHRVGAVDRDLVMALADARLGSAVRTLRERGVTSVEGLSRMTDGEVASLGLQPVRSNRLLALVHDVRSEEIPAALPPPPPTTSSATAHPPAEDADGDCNTQ